jgi:hypothetical protein
MNMKSLKTTALVGVVAGMTALCIYGQNETRFGAPAYSGAAAFTFGGTLTNFLILPAESSVKNADPNIPGAVPMVTHLDEYVQSADNGTPGVVVFLSTNQSSVFAGNNAASDPRNAVTSATNGLAYGAYSPGSGSNAYWLPGVVPIITNQFVVIKHQGILPIMSSYEPSIVISNKAVTYTNSFTNGANQVTTLIYTNTAIVLQGTAASLANPINAGDMLYFEVTNYHELHHVHRIECLDRADAADGGLLRRHHHWGTVQAVAADGPRHEHLAERERGEQP